VFIGFVFRGALCAVFNGQTTLEAGARLEAENALQVQFHRVGVVKTPEAACTCGSPRALSMVIRRLHGCASLRPSDRRATKTILLVD
jgi:hypothetical protein